VPAPGKEMILSNAQSITAFLLPEMGYGFTAFIEGTDYIQSNAMQLLNKVGFDEGDKNKFQDVLASHGN
jgi:hypothetical protein